MCTESIIGNHVESRINELIRLDKQRNASQFLAELKTGAGKLPSNNIEAMMFCYQNMPDEIRSEHIAYSTKSDIAVYTALTIYAFMQKNGSELDRPHLFASDIYPVNIGDALKQYIKKNKNDKTTEMRTINRLRSLVYADNPKLFIESLRNIAALLKQNDIKLDYVELAKDIYAWLCRERRDSIAIKWGKAIV